MVRSVKPVAYRFADDGIVPNNARWPFVLYRRAVHAKRLRPVLARFYL